MGWQKLFRWRLVLYKGRLNAHCRGVQRTSCLKYAMTVCAEAWCIRLPQSNWWIDRSSQLKTSREMRKGDVQRKLSRSHGFLNRKGQDN